MGLQTFGLTPMNFTREGQYPVLPAANAQAFEESLYCDYAPALLY
jgi:hypothetical protein